MSNNLRTFISIIMMLLCIHLGLNATHIVGGDLTYKYISSSNGSVLYEITLNLYRDTSPNSDAFPSQESFVVYEKLPNGEWELATFSLNVPRSNIEVVPYEENPCREEPTYYVGVETASFVTRMNLPIIESDYMIVVRECCRNSTISNIYQASTGATFDLLITEEAQKLGNSGPFFTNYPPIFVCTALTLNEDVSGTDVDGDSLAYRFTAPLDTRNNVGCQSFSSDFVRCRPPFNEVVWIPPYSTQAPMGGNPVVSLDAETGLMTGMPQYNGQYVVSMIIEEYREGKLLSESRRDFQFNSIACGEELDARIAADEIILDLSVDPPQEVYKINLCGPNRARVRSTSTGGTVIYDYEWEVTDTNGDLLQSAKGSRESVIEFDLPEYGIYKGRLILNNGLDCPDTARFHLYSNPDLDADFEVDVDSCFLASMAFMDGSTTEADEIVEWLWDFDGEADSEIQNPIYKFQNRGDKQVTLIAIDNNNCRDTLTTLVDYNPINDIDIPTEYDQRTICYGDSLTYDELIIKDPDTYLIKFTDEDTGCDTLELILELDFYIQPTFEKYDTILCPGETIEFYGKTIIEEGEYIHTIKSKVVDCDSLIETFTVGYHQKIDPSLNMTPLFDCFPGKYIVAAEFALEEDSLSWIAWDPGDGEDIKYENNFFYEYEERGEYDVELIIEDVHGCKEKFLQTITYDPPFERPEEVEENYILCAGETLSFGDDTIMESGVYKDKLQHAGTDCDSVFRTWVVDIQAAPREINIDTLKCPEDIVEFMGDIYAVGDNAPLTIKSEFSGCDSLIYYLSVSDFVVPNILFEQQTLIIPELVDVPFPISYDADNLASVTWSPADGLDCADCPYPRLNYDEDTRYTVAIESEDGCYNEASVNIHFIEILHYVPNTINENAIDERDRCFVVQKPEWALKTLYYDVQIFDRWGNLMYDEEDLLINDSSNCFSAEDMQPGVYVYKVHISEPDEEFFFTGTLTVLR